MEHQDRTAQRELAQIRHRLASGALLLEYPGVYRLGHRAPSLKARYLAAVRACGDGALLSGRAAACLLGLIKGPAPPPEVATPIERRVEGIITRRARAGRGGSRACLPRGRGSLRNHPARCRGRARPRPGSRGAAKLRRILRGDVHVTLSELERCFLDRLRSAGLVLPRTNRPAGGRRVDCRWPEQRLTVELDSYRYHSSRHAWEQDRRREREARARGDDFRRYTYGDVFEAPTLMLRELRAILPPSHPA